MNSNSIMFCFVFRESNVKTVDTTPTRNAPNEFLEIALAKFRRYFSSINNLKNFNPINDLLPFTGFNALIHLQDFLTTVFRIMN